MKLLLVEDDEDIRRELAELLGEEGFTVTLAENGAEGWDQLQAAQPELILLDMMMPIMNGWEFRKKQLQDPVLSLIPVIIMSGSARRTEDIGEGALVLGKPFEWERLYEMIKGIEAARGQIEAPSSSPNKD